MRVAGFRVLLLCCALTLQAADAEPAPPAPRQVVTIGGGDDNPPYAFLDEHGDPAGFDIELARAIAETMGLRVRFRLAPWATIRRELLDGQVDLLQGMYYSVERNRVVEFSAPHGVINYAAFARRGAGRIATLEDLKDKAILVQRDSLMHDYLLAHHLQDHLVPVASQAEALRLLASGQGDCALVGALAGSYIIKDNHLTNLVALTQSLGPVQNLCFATRKGDVALIDTFNEGLAILERTGRYQELRSRWFSPEPPSGTPWKVVLRYFMLGFTPLLLLLGVLFLWSRTLQRQVRHRTRELEREIQGHRAAQEQLVLRQQELVQADKLAALGILVSGVAHEINNPNGLLLMNLPFLRRFVRDTLPILDVHASATEDFTLAGLPYAECREELPEVIEEMLDGAQRIKRIVNDLKDFARRDDAGEKERVDLNRMVEVAVRLVEPTLRKATHHLRFDLAPGLPQVLCNAQQVEQIIVNLLLNACQALPSPDRGIQVRTLCSAGMAVLAVQDEGVGIASEHLGRLTDPFFTTKRDQGGTGLGLSVSAGLAKEHHGKIEFESQLGKGTTVTLSLPTLPTEAPA